MKSFTLEMIEAELVYLPVRQIIGDIVSFNNLEEVSSQQLETSILNN